MPQVMVRYRVKLDKVEENEELVRGVYAELAASRPEGLRYATFKLPDGVTFVHLAEHDEDNPLPKLESFKAFQAGLGERCDEPPAPARLDEIGSYRMFGEGQ